MIDGFVEDGESRYRDDPEDPEEDHRMVAAIYDGEGGIQDGNDGYDSDSGELTPVNHRRYPSVKSSRSTSRVRKSSSPSDLLAPPANGDVLPHQNGTPHITSFPDVELSRTHTRPDGLSSRVYSVVSSIHSVHISTRNHMSEKARTAFNSLPESLQKFLSKLYEVIARFLGGVSEFMNPPLWAMLVAILVASVPTLQHLFFDEGTFIRNSVTRAVGQSGSVAVPQKHAPCACC